MSENTPGTEKNSATNNATAFSRADAAKAVKRTTIEVVTDAKTKKPVYEKDGTVKTKEATVNVSADDVLDFAVRKGVVTVVTTDGQKLTGRVA